ncbi:YkvA family protein [Jeotgalibaca sp. A122]|uniref:YkvA family protein n=1 Tax=Jeotgalibaca sp. A122 TaxID=3457322 RepID=UPI003FD23C59
MQMRAKKTRTPVTKVKSLVTSLFDTKVKRRRKLMVLGIILYIVSPVDFIPDVIPMAGYADDVLIPILLMIAEKLMSSEDNKEHAK